MYQDFFLYHFFSWWCFEVGEMGVLYFSPPVFGWGNKGGFLKWGRKDWTKYKIYAFYLFLFSLGWGIKGDSLGDEVDKIDWSTKFMPFSLFSDVGFSFYFENLIISWGRILCCVGFCISSGPRMECQLDEWGFCECFIPWTQIQCIEG